MKYQIYCDGSCKMNGRDDARAHYAYVILDENDVLLRERHGDCDKNTNNVAEMTAMLKGLEDWKENFGNSVIVYTDSAYISNAYNQRWIDKWEVNGWMTANRTPVKNKELWIELQKFFKNSNVQIVKVKGHQGVIWNEYVDKIAQGGGF